MKTKTSGRIILYAALLGGFLAPGGAHAAPATVSVQVEKASVRSRPSALGKVIGQAAYAEQLAVNSLRPPWVEVTLSNGSTGWLHESSVSTRKVRMQAGDETVNSTASTDEVALAAKGFSEQVEKKYRSGNPKADFVWVDRMISWKVSPAESEQFLRQGKLIQDPAQEGR